MRPPSRDVIIDVLWSGGVSDAYWIMLQGMKGERYL